MNRQQKYVVLLLNDILFLFINSLDCLFLYQKVMNFNLYQTNNPERQVSNQPQTINQRRPIRYLRQSLSMTPKNKTGHWNQKQNAKYYAFLAKFKEKFLQKQVRRHWKVFKALAEFVQTRNANQCRSHHHKMQKNFRTIDETMEYLKQKRPGLQRLRQKYAQQLQKIEYKVFGEKKNDQTNSNMQIAIGGNYNAENQLKNVQLKNNIIPTADCYDQQVGAHGLREESYDKGQAQNIYDPFPTTGLLMSNLQNIEYPYQQKFEYSNLNNNSFGQNNPYKNRNLTYQQKLLECHECFVKWITKLNQIIQQQKLEEESKYSWICK